VASAGGDDDLGFTQRVADLTVEQFVAQGRIEAFDEAVLPRAAGGDVSGLRPDGADPLLHRCGDELRAIVGTDVLGDAAQDEQVRQNVDDVDGSEPAGYADGQTFVGKFVDDV